MLLCCYGTDDEAERLVQDPMFRLLLGKKRMKKKVGWDDRIKPVYGMGYRLEG